MGIWRRGLGGKRNDLMYALIWVWSTASSFAAVQITAFGRYVGCNGIQSTQTGGELSSAFATEGVIDRHARPGVRRKKVHRERERERPQARH